MAVRSVQNRGNICKSSVQRGIRSGICASYPYLESSGVIDAIFPKKEAVTVAKLADHVQLVFLDGVPLFFAQRDGPWLPTLRLLHQYPDMMPKIRCDKGAIKFLLSGFSDANIELSSLEKSSACMSSKRDCCPPPGANCMCPGLTSPGATIHEELEAKSPVAVYAEGKEHALAIGFTTMSTQEMREKNQGIGVENLHCLNDILWKSPHVD